LRTVFGVTAVAVGDVMSIGDRRGGRRLVSGREARNGEKKCEGAEVTGSASDYRGDLVGGTAS
jgi:hypothetical protein